MTLYQQYLARAARMNWADRRQAYEFLEYLRTYDAPANFYGRSIREMIADQPDGFATEQ